MNDPWLVPVSLPQPTLQDNTADAERLERALTRALASSGASAGVDASTDAGANPGSPTSTAPPAAASPPPPRIHVARALLADLPGRLPRAGGDCQALVFPAVGSRSGLETWEVLDVLSGAEAQRTTGLAVDLGTTRIVVRLVDLGSGAVLGERGFDNPQAEIGPDILVRIHHADTAEGLAQLQRLVTDRLNEAAHELCETVRRRPEDISLVTVAGNTAMTHLVLGLPPRWLVREPYLPVVNRPGIWRAADLGLALHPRARLYAFPNVGSYFGGDLLAGILHAGLDTAPSDAPEILVDVGTNAEVVVGNRDWLIACAGAAGPALEGGVTRMGMMAGPGAIDRVTVADESGTLAVHTIGNEEPRGICGSGLIDLAAALFRTGRVDIRGRFVPAACGSHLQETDGMNEYVVVPASRTATGEDLTLKQADLDSLVRSKAAMYTILETITAEVGLTVADVSRIQIAGTFGQFIDPESAITIGMIPDLPRETYQAIGNSALGGATLALQSRHALARAEALRDRITYLELNVNQAFMQRFSAAKFIPHTEPARFPSVTIPPQP